MSPTPGAIVFKSRVDDRDCFVRAAHHQAVAALQPEDPATGPDVDIVDALLLELGRTTHIIAIVGVATIDDDVALLHQAGELIDGPAGDAGWDHDPGHPRLLQLADKLLKGGSADRAFPLELLDRIRTYVINDTFMPVAH